MPGLLRCDDKQVNFGLQQSGSEGSVRERNIKRQKLLVH